MIKNLWIIDKVSAVAMPETLKEGQEKVTFTDASKNKNSFEVIITYEEDSERMLGGSFIKLCAPYKDEMFVTTSLTEGQLKLFVWKHFKVNPYELTMVYD
jgi:hypothetical protein